MTQHPVRKKEENLSMELHGAQNYKECAACGQRSNWSFVSDADGAQYCAWCKAPRLLSPSASPASGPDRSKCKAWCGHAYAATDVPYRCRCEGECDSPLNHAVMFTADNSPRSFVKDSDPVYCSPACRDARVPPLESKPAETGKCQGKCMQFVGTMDRPAWMVCQECAAKFEITKAKVKAKSTPAQEAPKAVGTVEFWQCDRCASDDDTKPTRFDSRVRMYCKPCRAGLEAWTMNQSGTPYAGPERLSKAKLAHSVGLEDPALEDA